jgi:hypothetical protein
MQGTSIAVPVRNLGESIRASLAGAVNTVVAALPRLIGFALVLVVGWLVSSLLARGVTALLHAIRFNDLARRSGFADFVQKMGLRQDASSVLAGVVKWFVRLIALVVAFDLLGLPAVSVVLQQLLLWLPNLVVALVVLVVGGLAARALGQLVRGSAAEAGLGDPDVLAAVTRVTVWAFVLIAAASQLGIATTVIDTLLVGVVGAVSLAAGLAFGLGGRDKAAQILDRIGQRARRTGPRLERSAGSAPEQANRTVVVAARNREFDESWIPRSGKDRRRVARPGIDRRVSAG